jgi:hypothetical protein
MPTDTKVKALDDLTHALKGRKNVKGEMQIEALERLDELLNNIPKQLEPEKQQEQQKQVTFDEATAPPKETRVPMTRPRTPAGPPADRQSKRQPSTNQSNPMPQLQGCAAR